VGAVGFAARAVKAAGDVGPELGTGTWTDVGLDTDDCTHPPKIHFEVADLRCPCSGFTLQRAPLLLDYGVSGCLRGSTGIGGRARARQSLYVACRRVHSAILP
jgi:hypothetical protein